MQRVDNQALVLDDAFTDRLVGKDETAFRQLISHYHRHMVMVARAIVGEAIAEEVVQEAWVSVYRSIERFQRRSSLKTWLTTIVSNEAKTRLRRESRQVSLEDLEGGESKYLTDTPFKSSRAWKTPPPKWELASPDALLEEDQLRQCLEKTLTLLAPKQKAAFLMRDMDQQPLEEICNVLGVSNSNIRVLLHRARLKLMDVIDHYQETGEC